MHVYIYFCYICGRRSGGTILLGITLLVTLCFSWPLHFALSVRSMFAALLAFNSPYLYILCLHFLCLPFHRPCSLSIASSLSLHCCCCCWPQFANLVPAKAYYRFSVYSSFLFHWFTASSLSRPFVCSPNHSISFAC